MSRRMLKDDTAIELVKEAVYAIAKELDQDEAPPCIYFVPYRTMNPAHQRAWRLAIEAVISKWEADKAP